MPQSRKGPLMETNTKLLRIESITDRVLAWIIQLPAPLSTVIVLLSLGSAFVAGLML